MTIQSTSWGWNHPAATSSPGRGAQKSPGHCPGSRAASAEELLLGLGTFSLLIFPFSPGKARELHTAAAAPAATEPPKQHLREQVASSALLSLPGLSLSPIIPAPRAKEVVGTGKRSLNSTWFRNKVHKHPAEPWLLPVPLPVLIWWHRTATSWETGQD